MRLAVALLLILAAFAILALQASHGVASQSGNQTGNQTSADASLNHTTAVNNSTHNSNNQTNTTGNHSTNQTNPTQQNNNSTNSTGHLHNYNYNSDYNNYYDNDTDENYTGTNHYQDNSGDNVDYSRTGAIAGVILASPGSHAVPNANVALYDENDNPADTPDNPQLSSNGTGNNSGVYMFYDVPYGYYTVKAEKGGVEFFAVVNLGGGTATANVVLPEYVETESAYQEPLPPEVPTPAPKPFRYFLPITVGKMPAAARPDEGLPFGLAAVGGIGAPILFTRRNGKA
jgi:hypothetical protein